MRAYFEVEGDFRLVQRPSRWAGEALVRSLMWLRQVFRDPELAGADLLYSRIPAMLGDGAARALALRHRSLPALAGRSAGDPAAGPADGAPTEAASASSSIPTMPPTPIAGPGVAEEKILVAHNGANPRRLGEPAGQGRGAGARSACPQDRPIALYAGRINAQKGLDSSSRSPRLRPEILFVLVGSEGRGPDRARGGGAGQCPDRALAGAGGAAGLARTPRTCC